MAAEKREGGRIREAEAVIVLVRSCFCGDKPCCDFINIYEMPV